MKSSERTTISATELVRNLPAVIDRVRLSRRPLAITKGRQTVASLEPPPRTGYPIAQLAELLSAQPELGRGGASMADDLARIRRGADLPANPWDS